jgi:hypothetical protein
MWMTDPETVLGIRSGMRDERCRMQELQRDKRQETTEDRGSGDFICEKGMTLFN